MKPVLALTLASLLTSTSLAQQKTFCNPINIDTMYGVIPDFANNGLHRATADPAIVRYRGDYYLFSTNQWGYWWSADMANWHFVARKFLKPYHHVYDDLCAPAPFVMGDALYVFGSTYTSDFPIWKSTNPKGGEWTEAVGAFTMGGWDPAFFLDDDGRLFFYHGSSNDKPIYGTEVDPKTLQSIGEHLDLIHLDDQSHGWERFGEHYDNVFLKPFIEGAWMTKHAGKYYLQYGAPGTEFSGYADGVYIGDHPLGPFTYQAHNPFSYKPGGFAQGAGHGSTFQDAWKNLWHTSTIRISVKNNFERRVGIWPAGFDRDGVMYCDTAYGDYPTYLPFQPSDHLQSRFTGWMLLNYCKPVTVSSTYGGYSANNAVDESMRTYWCATSGGEGEWLMSDLGEVSTVRAIQINYADQDATILGREPGMFHRYILYSSLNGRNWKVFADKSKNKTDVPNDYVELAAPLRARYVKIKNLHMPTGKFALSGFRIFGKGAGEKPEPVQDLIALRGDSERRASWLKWRISDHATGYVIRTGVAPNKLYTSIMVYGQPEYYWGGMDKDRAYYFQIEAFNENGVSARSSVIKVD